MAMGTSSALLALTHEEPDYYRWAGEYGDTSPEYGAHGMSDITKWSRHGRATFGTDQICEYVAGRKKTVVMFDTISASV